MWSRGVVAVVFGVRRRVGLRPNRRQRVSTRRGIVHAFTGDNVAAVANARPPNIGRVGPKFVHRAGAVY